MLQHLISYQLSRLEGQVDYPILFSFPPLFSWSVHGKIFPLPRWLLPPFPILSFDALPHVSTEEATAQLLISSVQRRYQQDISGWRWKDRGIRWIFSQKQEVKSVAGRYSVSSHYNLIAVKVVVKDLIYLCILSIICNCLLFSQELGSCRTTTSLNRIIFLFGFITVFTVHIIII